MKPKERIVKRVASFIIIFILFAGLGCATVPSTYVAVREARFRSEVSRDDRISLPLDEGSRKRLITFLKAGGDKDKIGMEIVDPDAESHYTPLLDLLSDPDKLNLEDLTERQTYKSWFSDGIVRQVIDAREDSPPVIDPVAVSDGKYWWIFYHRHKKLTELLVVKGIPAKQER
jgi:hypothetical protein